MKEVITTDYERIAIVITISTIIVIVIIIIVIVIVVVNCPNQRPERGGLSCAATESGISLRSKEFPFGVRSGIRDFPLE